MKLTPAEIKDIQCKLQMKASLEEAAAAVGIIKSIWQTTFQTKKNSRHSL